MLIRFVIFMAVFFNPFITCSAQSISQAEKLSGFIEKNDLELGRVHMNLLQMSGAISAAEEVNVSSAAGCINSISSQASLLNAYVSISMLMIDPRDRATVKKFIPINSKATIKIADYCTDRLNAIMPSIKNQAILLELQKARNLIGNLRDEINANISVKTRP